MRGIYLVVRSTDGGPLYLVRPDHPDGEGAWTEDRDWACRYGDRTEAEADRAAAVARDGQPAEVEPVEE